MSSTNDKEHKKTLHAARQKFRLCAAAEYVFAKLGAHTTVADIIKEAGMSRRSFYEFFESREHIVECMEKMRSRILGAPHASWMLLAWAPQRTDIDPTEAFQAARGTALERRTLNTQYAPDDATLLTWFLGAPNTQAPEAAAAE